MNPRNSNVSIKRITRNQDKGITLFLNLYHKYEGMTKSSNSLLVIVSHDGSKLLTFDNNLDS